jgi:hydrogenase maturation protease
MDDEKPMNPRGTDSAAHRIKVLGVGNLLWADEGFGIRCVEALGEAWDFPPEVELLDGGTLGLALIPLLQDATHVLLFDTVDYGGTPGSLLVARDAEIPRYMTRGKMSLHQAGMNDVLASLEMLGHRPEAFTLVGVQPVELADYGGSLTPLVREQLPKALALGLAELATWGVTLNSRGPASSGQVMTDALVLDRYEGERPTEDVAWRRGDERFLGRPGGRPGPADDEGEKGP